MSFNRNATIDVSRGIAIILVVLGHSLGESSQPLNKLILSFHMPLFFFLSGMVWRKKNDNYFSFLKCKTFTLLIPQLTLGILYSLYTVVIAYKILHTIEFQNIDFIDCFFRWWFLLVLFWVTIIWEGVARIFNNFNYLEIIISVVSLVVAFLIGNRINLPLYIHVIPTGMLFYAVGILFNKYKVMEQNWFDGHGWYVLLIPVLVMISIINTPVLMYDNKYGNYILFIIGAGLGIYLVLMFAEVLKNDKMLQLAGINSIIIYVVHFCLVQGFRGIVSRIFTNVDAALLPWVVFLCVSILLIPIVYICGTKFGILFGKRKIKNQHI